MVQRISLGIVQTNTCVVKIIAKASKSCPEESVENKCLWHHVSFYLQQRILFLQRVLCQICSLRLGRLSGHHLSRWKATDTDLKKLHVQIDDLIIQPLAPLQRPKVCPTNLQQAHWLTMCSPS